MKKSGKVFCLLFTVLMLFTLSVTAFAGNETNDSNIRIEVTTDKNSYKAWGVAEITATITNVSGEDISNVTAQAVFNDLAPAGKRTSETSKSVDVLKSGESFSFTYKATLNKSEHKLNIIEKIILFFVRLFNGGYNADNNNIDVVAENVTEIEFGKYTAENVIQVGYGETSYYSTKDIKDKHIVGDEVSQFMSSEVYQSMEEDEKANSVIELLSKYEADGLIEKGSINYNEATKAIHFNYASGIPSVVLIKTEKKYSDPWLNPIGLVNNDSTTFTRQNESSTITKSNSNNPIKSVLMYGFDKPGADNRVLSAWSNSCESKTGMQTTILDCPTVYEFKTALLDKDYICIFEHGNYGGILADTYVFKVQNEEVTEATDIAYDTDIYFKRIIECYDDNGEKVYCITPNFFEFYYKDKLTDSIVYLISCQGFGVDSIVDYGIADILIEQCGVKTVVGFHNSVAQCYAFRIYDEITDLLLKGFTIGEAYDCTIDELGATDYTFLKEHLFEVEDMSTRREWLECANEKKENGSATFLIYGDKSTTLITPSILTGTVTDSETGNPISNVTVEAIDNESESLDPIVTATTDSNGKYTLKLPYGDYSLSYKHSDYEDYGTSLTVNYESYTKDVTLSPKGSDSGDDSTGESGDTEDSIDFAGGDGTEENPYQIETPAQLNAVRNNLSAHYIQIADIDMSVWDNWEPIGDTNSSFVGVFDGNGFDIKSLTINYTGSNTAIGLFGYATNSIVKNVTITSGNIGNANDAIYLGSVVGYGNEIINCSSSTEISANCSYGGGIAGYAKNIENCTFKGGADFYSDTILQDLKIYTQSRTSGYFGGVCGATKNISCSKNIGQIYACGKYSTFAGGITGCASLVSECYNIGTITLETTGTDSYSPEAYLGGISGVSQVLTDCYNTGMLNVKSNNYSGMVGGISGLGYGNYSYCYNIGKLTNNSKYSWYKGGIIGVSHIYSSTLQNCYSNISTIVGSGNVTSKYVLEECAYLSNNELISSESYKGFDFNNIWTISNTENNGYPHLTKLGY